MLNPFDEAMKFLWKWEGGYSNHPSDPGGATNLGITLRTAIENGLDIDHDGDVDVDDIKQMTPQAAYSVYKHKYWDAIDANNLPWDLAIAAFDAAVNCGPGRVKGWIQIVKNHDNPVRDLMELRRIHYLNIVMKNPSLRAFKDGWTNRTNDLRKFIDLLRLQSPQNDGVPSQYQA